MNTHAEYRRHSHWTPDPVTPTTSSRHDLEGTDGHLLHHRDPSLTPGVDAQPPSIAGVTWVRPTEMAAYIAPAVGRGVDAQAALIRRTRRAPASTARALPRLIPNPAPATSTPTRTEGPSL